METVGWSQQGFRVGPAVGLRSLSPNPEIVLRLVLA